MAELTEKRIIEILRFEKITRLEGIYIEELFKKSFLKDNLFSDNWWVAKKKTNRKFSLIKHLFDTPTVFDMEIADSLCEDFNIYFVIQKGDMNWHALSKCEYAFISYEKGDTVNSINAKLDGTSNRLKRLKVYLRDKVTKSEEDRLLECFRLMQEIGINFSRLLKSRIMANMFGSETMWDVDYFSLVKGKKSVLEVKQKYPSRADTIGLNAGSKNTLNLFRNAGFRVFNIILLKPMKNKDIGLRQQIETDPVWFFHEIIDNSFESPVKFSPKGTSYSQTYRLKYYEQAFSDYKSLCRASEAQPEYLKKLE